MPTNKNARVWTGTEWANISAPVAVPNAIAYYQTTAPSSPTTGQVWVNSTTETFYVWSGTAWEQQNVDLSAYLTSATAAATYVSAATVSSTYAPKASPVFTGTVDASSANFVPPVQTSGRNRIINGSFDVWQRGTSPTSTSGSYTADRWYVAYDGSGATRAVTAQTFTLGAAPVAGYESKYFLRYTTSVAGSGGTYTTLEQKMESVRTFAGQTINISFWAKAASNMNISSIFMRQYFGTGGTPSTTVDTTLATSISVTTSWQRFTYSVTIPSISGKNIGTNNDDYFNLIILLPSNALWTFDIWGVQVEKGAVATPFETEPYGDILRKCQRYYYRTTAGGTGSGNGGSAIFSTGYAYSTTAALTWMTLPVRMRARPIIIDSANLYAFPATLGAVGISTIGINTDWGQEDRVCIFFTATSITSGAPYMIGSNSSVGFGYIGVSAEL